MTFESREDTSLILRLRDARLRLKEARVEVGLPASAPARSRWLLALHERGAPAAGIPPRPVIGPALADPGVRQAMAGALEEACQAIIALGYKPQWASAAVHKAYKKGMSAEDVIKAVLAAV